MKPSQFCSMPFPWSHPSVLFYTLHESVLIHLARSPLNPALYTLYEFRQTLNRNPPKSALYTLYEVTLSPHHTRGRMSPNTTRHALYVPCGHHEYTPIKHDTLIIQILHYSLERNLQRTHRWGGGSWVMAPRRPRRRFDDKKIIYLFDCF